MVDIRTLKVGDQVHYQPEHYGADEWENGIVKEIPRRGRLESEGGYVRVVYHCAGDWENYRNYTGALTDVNHLKHGWRE